MWSVLLSALQCSEYESSIIPNHFGRPTIDWKDRDALLMLTRVLLWHYHSLHFQLPPDHLCPTVRSNNMMMRKRAGGLEREGGKGRGSGRVMRTKKERRSGSRRKQEKEAGEG